MSPSPSPSPSSPPPRQPPLLLPNFVSPVPLPLSRSPPLSTCRRNPLFAPRPPLSRRSPRVAVMRSHPPHPSSESTKLPLWRRLLAVTTLSASVLFAPLPSLRPAANAHQPRLTNVAAVPALAVTVSTTPKSSTSNTSRASDVESAALTLAAVSVGALVMRAVINSQRDEDAYRQKVAEQSKRLQEEEDMRALRIQRSEMEAVYTDDPTDTQTSEDNDQFMQAFRERVSGLNMERDPDDQEEDDDSTDKYDKQQLDLVNMPDRSTGSAVLDKPDDISHPPDAPASSQEPVDTPDQTDDQHDAQPPSMANPEQAEMLKRMWNLNSFDKKND